MGQRKEPTPSVSSASSEVSTASTASIHKRSTPKIAAIIIVAFLVIASLAGVTVYFIISEKLLMNKSQTRTVEKRIDEYNYREEIIPGKTNFWNFFPVFPLFFATFDFSIFPVSLLFIIFPLFFTNFDFSLISPIFFHFFPFFPFFPIFSSVSHNFFHKKMRFSKKNLFIIIVYTTP